MVVVLPAAVLVDIEQVHLMQQLALCIQQLLELEEQHKHLVTRELMEHFLLYQLK